MPTGYTHDVETGKIAEFKDFAWRCARAMGACIMMRDDPMDAPIPERFEPSPFYRESLEKARAEYAEFRGFTETQRRARYDSECEKVAATNAKWKSDREEVRQRYEAMLAKARAWEPPTADVGGLKTFMVEQLRESIRLDCSDISMPAPPPYEKWCEATAKKLYENVGRYAKEWEGEVQRTESRNDWIAALRKSLA